MSDATKLKNLKRLQKLERKNFFKPIDSNREIKYSKEAQGKVTSSGILKNVKSLQYFNHGKGRTMAVLSASNQVICDIPDQNFIHIDKKTKIMEMPQLD